MLKPRKRLVKTQLKEDQFVLMTAKAEAWFELHRMKVLYGIVAVVVAVGLGLAINWSRTTAAKNATFDEMLARDAYARADFDSALIRADAILDDYSGTSSAAVALMLKGRIFEQRAQFDEAVKAFEAVIDDYSGEDYLAFGAYYALGTIAAGKSEFEKAAEYYEKAASKYSKHFNAPAALLEAGKAFDKANKSPQAKSMYRKILSDYSKSRAADAARDNLAKLEFMP